ncbi:hypothetical protein QNI19_38640 [Cytophagaceae bacterium DM2B3-1]|uniref:DUF3078 domain-containing protein n=1 Tax=Xanthocytophaga flava TaxID=3048013 RepID=A0ABT7CYU6_9BACT|nr:hypothetical protein [Xanthocytophaga flavus]MDJ1498910.1 hypothetical protein [Xanthocytophaga flavus]
MRKFLFIIITCFSFLASYSQSISNHQLNQIISILKTQGKSDEEIKNVVNGIINNPDLYNGLWKEFIEQAYKSDSTKWKFLKDLNIQFKTFQATDNAPTALGFTYDFDFDYAYFKESNDHKFRLENSFGFSAKGNVAFNQKLNPTDFLETKVNYNLSGFSGGIIKAPDTTIYSRLNATEDALILINDMQSKEAVTLWEEFGRNLYMSNQYYRALSPKFSLESNQDFSKIQWTPGLAIDLGAKAWDKNTTLSKINIFDYPFALLRWIVGTDKSFTPYGSTIPTIQFVADYVVPSNDTVRENLVGNTKPYPRIKFETGFRTFISRIKKDNIFFNANFRYYEEINAPNVIKKAKLNSQTYFVMALQSTSGFYVSYANGKLPFDAKNDEVYSIGFNYKF